MAVTDLAPLLQRFFTEYLITERALSPNTIISYRDTVRLLLLFSSDRTGRRPARLTLSDLDADTVKAFLIHLETGRGNTTATRNTRLAAIHTLFGYAFPLAPEHAQSIARVLAIPAKKTGDTLVDFLIPEEIDALLAAPDRTTWHGRRDHALMLLDVVTGLRVSELAGLTRTDLQVNAGPHVSCIGKGRKQRCVPLKPNTIAVMKVWLAERGGTATDPVFPTRRGAPLSTDAVERLVAKHASTAADVCASLTAKNVTPHTLRHSCAMNLLRSGVDTSVIALWLGHESPEYTKVYLHADMTIKEQALARVTPPGTPPGRYRATDALIAFLNELSRPPSA
jgi:integrase/recombinase XerD